MGAEMHVRPQKKGMFSLSGFTRNWTMSTNFNKFPNSKFHENSFSGSRDICGQPERHGDENRDILCLGKGKVLPVLN
jgi:hypothetical protein